ncbi:PP2C family protein-serine/threonine phosphatase [Streptomyces millisiae]|uniref:PP2C family protein-serine/threonine phosphatase n=1 Tax=Streptomyces millisiae TaxID=3075542 RepID=A0ABU2LKI4_9ACTN|nr:PP2C family protein-serine/threonine phosphatase [Streptomyces sp. DSM 44918]MDT0318100.1 PP2C family protein-serine/threonine phosphatase [Streptomyces sp. DSM 44918]
MTSSPPPKVAGIHPARSALSEASAPGDAVTRGARGQGRGPGIPQTCVQDRLASWISDLTTLHDLTERLGRTRTLGDALQETLRAGAGLVGARRGLISLAPADGLGPRRLAGLGLGHADLGQLETVPRGLDAPQPGAEGEPAEAVHGDIAREDRLDPRHREVAARLGFAASYAVPLTAESLTAGAPGALGAAVWLYDQPGQPDVRQRHLLALYLRQAGQHIANRLELSRARDAVAAVHEGLLPSRLPPTAGVRLAVRHRSGPRGGGDFYDALPLPDAALGLAVGGTTGAGPAALAAMGRLRAGLRAYAVMEGEDPVAVLSDLELLLRLTEPGRSATVLFGYAEPAVRRVTLASAGHPPPLVIGRDRAEFAETGLSAPLNMLACWEAPSVRIELAEGETVLLYSDGLLLRTGEPMDRAFARLGTAARTAPPAARADPEALLDHVLATMLPDPGGAGTAAPAEDVVLLAARFC